MVFLPRPKDAVRAIKKRIVGNKSFMEIMLALTVSIISGLSIPFSEDWSSLDGNVESSGSLTGD